MIQEENVRATFDKSNVTKSRSCRYKIRVRQKKKKWDIIMSMKMFNHWHNVCIFYRFRAAFEVVFVVKLSFIIVLKCPIFIDWISKNRPLFSINKMQCKQDVFKSIVQVQTYTMYTATEICVETSDKIHTLKTILLFDAVFTFNFRPMT